MEKLIIEGKNNYGKPKQEYADKLAVMTEQELFKSTEQMIWLAAYASNNPRSDYHWQCDACHSECVRRNNVELYSAAHKAAMKSAGY